MQSKILTDVRNTTESNFNKTICIPSTEPKVAKKFKTKLSNQMQTYIGTLVAIWL